MTSILIAFFYLFALGVFGLIIIDLVDRLSR